MHLASRTAIDELKPKILAYLKDPVRGQTKGHLMGEFDLKRGRTVASGLPESRVLDRALQELRKEGAIRYDLRQWFLTTSG